MITAEDIYTFISKDNKNKESKLIDKVLPDFMTDKDKYVKLFQLFIDLDNYQFDNCSIEDIGLTFEAKLLLYYGAKQLLIDKCKGYKQLDEYDPVIFESIDDKVPNGYFFGWTLKEMIDDDPYNFWIKFVEMYNFLADFDEIQLWADYTLVKHSKFVVTNKQKYAYRHFNDDFELLEYDLETQEDIKLILKTEYNDRRADN